MLKGYEVKEKMEDGRLYAVVELEDGTTFGQIVSARTVEEMDQAIKESAERVMQGDQPSEVDELIGQFRTVSASDELQDGR